MRKYFVLVFSVLFFDSERKQAIVVDFVRLKCVCVSSGTFVSYARCDNCASSGGDILRTAGCFTPREREEKKNHSFVRVSKMYNIL